MIDINENLESKKNPIQPIQQLKGVGGWLLLFIIGTFLSTVLNFMIAIQTGSTSFLSSGYLLVSNQYVSSLLGLFALVTGIMLIAVRNIYSVWAARIYMILYLIGSIVVAITGLEAPSGHYVMNEGGIIIKGIFSALLLNVIWQSYFLRSKRIKATYPIISDVQADAQFEIGKTLTSLFNKQKLGINYYVGVAFFLTMAISWFSYTIYYALWYGYTLQFLPLSFFLAYRIPLVILYSVLLIFLLHALRNDWLAAILIGFGTSILSLIFQLIFSNVSFGDITMSHTLAPTVLISNFIGSFFLLLSMSLAMKTWGFKWWSFIVWIPIGYVVTGLLIELMNLIQYKENTFSLSFLPINILQGIIVGTIFYFNIYFFLKKKGVLVRKAG